MEVSFRALYTAANQCRRGKAKGSQSQRYQAQLLDNLFDTQWALQSCLWQPSTMRVFIASNGTKPREIHAPSYADRVVHHWLVPQLQRLIEHKFIHDCAANVKGRGTHFAVHRLQRMFRQVAQAHPATGAWYLQLDIHNFFYSIHKPTLLALLARHLRRAIADGIVERAQARHLYLISLRVLQPVQQVVVVGDRSQWKAIPHHKQLAYCPPDVGLPIGNLTSQFFSNLYLNELDQFVKHQLKCRHYLRYVDDFILVHHSREQLQHWQQQIETFIAQRLHLRLKAEKKLALASSGADFLGYIIRPHYLLVRRRVYNNWCQKLADWYTTHIANQRTSSGYWLRIEALEHLQAVCASYRGHMHHASYFSLVARLFHATPWLQCLFQLRRGLLVPRYKVRRAKSFRAQWRWFVCQWHTTCVLMQKGRMFVIDSRCRDWLAQHACWLIGQVTADKTSGLWQIPIKHLSAVRHCFRVAHKSHVWIHENGYRHNRLKNRELAYIYLAKPAGL